MDLFTPIVPQDRYHPAFATVLTQANAYDKAVLSQWAEGFVDRDGKFVKEFQTTFDSSFWELYLFAAFKELGLTCDFQWSRPDFCVISPKTFLAEATVSLNAAGKPSVSETRPLEAPPDYNTFNKGAIVRLCNSIHAKHKKYVESYSRLAHVEGRPFVLAIAPFDRPHFQLQAQRPVEAVLYRSYVDETSYLEKHPLRDVPLKPLDLPVVSKDSGELLPLGLFCNPNMAEISAVIQSTAATWSKVKALGGDPDVTIDAIYEDRVKGGQYVYRGPNSRYSEGILDGLRVYHNPYATHPLDPSVFRREEIFQATATGAVDALARIVMLNGGRRNLVNRSSTAILPSGLVEESLKGMPSDTSFWHSVPASRVES